jgi:hypothetical protein
MAYKLSSKYVLAHTDHGYYKATEIICRLRQTPIHTHSMGAAVFMPNVIGNFAVIHFYL